MRNGQYLIGFAYEMEAWDSQGNLIEANFDKKVRLIFYIDTDVIGDVNLDELEVAYYSTNLQEWIPLDNVVMSLDDPLIFITGQIDHFSKMGVLSTTPTAAEDNYIYLPIVIKNYGG